MQYFEAYGFFFRSPKWWLNLLIGAVSILVPIAGPMVLLGWACTALERSPRRWEPGSDFDPNKLGKYIARGVWPVLVQIVIGLPLSFIFGFIWVALMMGTTFAFGTQTDQGGPPRILLLVFPTYILGFLFLSVLVQMISLPIALRAAFMQDFVPAFNLPWAIDFIKRTGGEMLLSMLFLLVTAPFVALAGLLACCVGYLPAIALIQLAHYHIWFQLYDLFLQRGGDSIPIKVTPPDPNIQPEER
jgi:hypothetical protein